MAIWLSAFCTLQLAGIVYEDGTFRVLHAISYRIVKYDKFFVVDAY